jgi:hypothetical protein
MNRPVVPRPYPEDEVNALGDEVWASLPLVPFPTGSLVPSQTGLSLDRLALILAGAPPEGGGAPRVVSYEGVRYIHDGTHRWIIAAIRNEEHFEAHWLAL